MKLQTTVTLSESQKAQIVARGEELEGEYIFDMSRKYAAIFPRLQGTYKAFQVTQDLIQIDRLQDMRVPEYRDTDGKWINKHEIQHDFYNAIATGALKDGASCDTLMRKIEKLLDAEDAAKQAERQKAEEKAAREKRERPAREAKEAREAEEKRIAKEAREAKEAEQKATKQAEIETAKAEKLAWIEAHGSERLQKGIAAGYYCQKVYVAERGKTDLGGGYELDYDAKIERKDRSCPTLEALNEAERLNEAGITAKVVWLPDGTATEEDCYEYDCDMQDACEAVEAILIGQYFYKTF